MLFLSNVVSYSMISSVRVTCLKRLLFVFSMVALRKWASRKKARQLFEAEVEKLSVEAKVPMADTSSINSRVSVNDGPLQWNPANCTPRGYKDLG